MGSHGQAARTHETLPEAPPRGWRKRHPVLARALLYGLAFALAAVFCAISLLPLMRGLATAPKVEDQTADPPAEAAPATDPAAAPAVQSA